MHRKSISGAIDIDFEIFKTILENNLEILSHIIVVHGDPHHLNQELFINVSRSNQVILYFVNVCIAPPCLCHHITFINIILNYLYESAKVQLDLSF